MGKHHWSDEGVSAVLLGCILKPDLVELVDQFSATAPAFEIDLLHPTITSPEDGNPPLVSCLPPQIKPDMRVQEVYIMMRQIDAHIVYVTSGNNLLGYISMKELLGHTL